MRARFVLTGLALLALAACGQPPATEAPKATAVPPAPVEAPILDASGLPAPYDAANLQNGKNQFAKCAACHAAGPGAPNRTGPSLHGMFGRKAGKADGFVYSDAFLKANFTWDAIELDKYLTDPRGYLPGNRMAFIGIKKEEDRRDLIAYLLLETKRAK